MTLRITRTSPDDGEAGAALDRYYAELAARFPDGFDLARTVAAPPAELVPPHGSFLLARLEHVVVGCGGVRLLDRDVAEIKRMWADPAYRGRGIGRRLLAALEDEARGLGASAVRLDTAGSLHEARGLYASAGYAGIAAYNDNPYAAHWFEKSLDPPTPSG